MASYLTNQVRIQSAGAGLFMEPTKHATRVRKPEGQGHPAGAPIRTHPPRNGVTVRKLKLRIAA